LTEATLEAQMLLWEWAESCEDDDPEQREMKVRYAEGLVDACEHAGLLAADEVVQWGRLLAQGGRRLRPRATSTRPSATSRSCSRPCGRCLESPN
jgi:hypothetical protein